MLLIGQLMYVLLILLQCHVWHLTMQPMSSLGKIPLDCLCSSNATVEWASFWLHRRLHHSQCHDYCHFHSDRPPGDHSIWVIPNSPSIDMGLLQGLSLYPGKIMQPKIKEFFYRLVLIATWRRLFSSVATSWTICNYFVCIPEEHIAVITWKKQKHPNRSHFTCNTTWG